MTSVSQFYDQGIYQASEENLTVPSPTFLQMLRLFTPQGGGRLLDIGCGDGVHTRVIRDYIGAEQAVGLDISAARLRFGQRQGLAVVVGDLDQGLTSMRDSSFDVIHCGEVIEHLFNPDSLLRGIARLLKPGGYAVLSTPNLASWRNRIALMLGWQPFWSEVSTEVVIGNPRCWGQPCGHLRLFTPRALLALSAHHGLKVERLIGLAQFQDVPPRDLVSWLADRADSLVPSLFPSLGDGLAVRLSRADSDQLGRG
jgi:methionine biosynthesis protein MetW